MARVLYAVMGNTHGHIMRTQSIVRRLPQHEFYFVGGGRVPGAFQDRYPVLEVPVLRTVHKKQAVSVWGVIQQIFSCVCSIPQVRRKILNLVEEFKPDVVIVDREFFTPIALLGTKIPVLGIDHSHVMKACHYPVPSDQWISWGLAMLNDYFLFDFTRKNLIVSFFHPHPKKGNQDELFPAVVRPEVLEVAPRQGDYILLYQTSNTFGALLEALKNVSRRVVVYGFRNEHVVEGNITYKPYDPRAILDDLAGCYYAIVNGGHNLISEALYYGKPVFCFPIHMLFEQYINAWHVRALGYGDFSTTRHPTPEMFMEFEKKVSAARDKICVEFHEGTEPLVKRVDQFITTGS